MTTEEKIEGTLEKITYRNEQNGYTVAVLRVKNDTVSVVGTLPFLSEGESVELSGNFVIHPVYGEQFSVKSFVRKAPKTEAGILRYLSSGIIKGVGPATAERIVERFGKDSLSIIKDSPEELSLIKGITAEKALLISEEYNRLHGVKDVMLLLSSYQISVESCVKVYNDLGSEACEKIKENPYLLCKEPLCLPFEKAERMAFDFGVSPDDERRILAGIVYILRRNLANGHTCLPKAKVKAVAMKLLSCEEETVASALTKLTDTLEIISRNVNGKEFLALYEYYYAEERIAARLLSIDENATRLLGADDLEIDYVENKTSIKFHENQRQAIKSAVESGVFVLTGGPGTGKTTTLNAIIELLTMRKLDIALAAPTGRAAKRMTELCGREAKTIHRLLEVDWNNEDKPEFSRNEKNPLECDVILIDEASMVDVMLFDSLLKALRPNCRVILVGDSNQLPSIQAGNILNDIIESEKFSFVCLKKVFRQAGKSQIVTTAHALINETPVDFNNKSGDLFFLSSSDGFSLSKLVTNLATERLPLAYGFNPVSDIQIICPSRLYETGTVNLNNILQSRLNPESSEKTEIINKGVTFRVGDKVMQTKNNYNIVFESDRGENGMGIFNGDVGFITEIDRISKSVKVRYDDKTASYLPDEVSELELAYAITTHKSQGSEFNCCIVPLYNVPKKLRYRNLLYTAITRAKKMLIIVGEKEIFREMAANNKKTLRYTLLKENLI